MVLIDDRKYACETCIKGHRSSACKHTDRPLYEIKKKGRPVTQCEHCRELRKTKQVHVKCICESKEQVFSSAGSSKKGSNKVPSVATFPNGLPAELEASVALQLMSEGSSDSEHSGDQSSASNCKCKNVGSCNCCTPRRALARRRSSGQASSRNERQRFIAGHQSGQSLSSPPPAQVLARIAELRPVLPRPPWKGPSSEGPLHSPSAGLAHGHSTRHHIHDHMHFSPYGRAYEQSHVPDLPFQHDAPISLRGASPMTQSTPAFETSVSTDNESISDVWIPPEGVFPSACTCGDSCRCPGCTVHHNSTIPPANAYSVCADPAGCSFCLDCTILSLPAPPDSVLSLFEDPQDIDEWLRQISVPHPQGSSFPAMSQLPDVPSDLTMTSIPPFSPSSWENLGIPQLTQSLPQVGSPAETRCSGQCNCAAGQCECPQNCCGCCQGCECERCEHHQTTFATSGERGSCSAAGQNQLVGSVSPVPGGHAIGMDSARLNPSIRNTSYPEPNNFLSVASAMRSRSSSTSSETSHRSSGAFLAPAAHYPGGRPVVLLNKDPIHSHPHLSQVPSPSGMSPSVTASGSAAPYSSVQYSSTQSSAAASPHSAGLASPDGITAYTGGPTEVEGLSVDPQYDTYAQYNPSLDSMQLY